MVVEAQRLGAALALVVAGARTDRVDVAPVGLGLRMLARVAVDLARRRLEHLRPGPLGEPQHVDRPVHRGLRRLHRIELVVDRARRTREVVDLVDLDVERKGHVVPHQLEARRVEQVRHVRPPAGKEVVDAEHLVARRHQPLAEVAAEKPRPAGHQHPLRHHRTHLGELRRYLAVRCLAALVPLVIGHLEKRGVNIRPFRARNISPACPGRPHPDEG